MNFRNYDFHFSLLRFLIFAVPKIYCGKDGLTSDRRESASIYLQLDIQAMLMNALRWAFNNITLHSMNMPATLNSLISVVGVYHKGRRSAQAAADCFKNAARR
jgi:trehalose utilization protein